VTAPSELDSSLYAFVSDLSEGADAVGRVLDRFGVRGLTVAAAYHRARDVTPHGAARLVSRRDGAHFRPDPALFAGLRLVPPVQDDAGSEPLRRLRAATRAGGAALHGWTVFCHNTTLGSAHPECAVRSCFGDRAAPADLCPAHPEVRAYAVALARNVAGYGVDSVVAESLHFGAFRHGYHHERSFVPLGALDEFLFGLCFCGHCLARAQGQGVDAEAAQAECAAALERVLAGGRPGPDEVTPESLAEYAGAHTAGYALARAETVTSLVAEVAAGVRRAGSRLVFLDLTGAALGYASGHPTGPVASRQAWRLGIDPGAVGRAADGYGMLGYAHEVRRVRADAAAYRAALGPDRPLRVLLRPGHPDTTSARELTAKVDAARGHAGAVDFYHYGLNSWADLDRIPLALGRGAARGEPPTTSAANPP
jgi:hypothetical protein